MTPTTTVTPITTVTAAAPRVGTASGPAIGTCAVSGPDMKQLHRRYPARDVPVSWPGTCLDRDVLVSRLLAPPFTDPAMRVRRTRGVVSVVDWLGDQPGRTWQERWQATGADALGNADWWRPFIDGLQSGSQRHGDSVAVTSNLRVSLLLLIGADAIRPSLGWLLTPFAPHHLATDLARVRDREGFTELSSRCDHLRRWVDDDEVGSTPGSDDRGSQGRPDHRHHRRGLPGAGTPTRRRDAAHQPRRRPVRPRAGWDTCTPCAGPSPRTATGWTWITRSGSP